jgi:hypothetical protein
LRARAVDRYSRVRVEQADAAGGFAELANYRRIIATLGLGEIPPSLWSQLRVGGRLVLLLAMRGVIKTIGFRKDWSGRLIDASVKSANFMPVRGAAPLPPSELRLGPELGLFVWLAEHPRRRDAEVVRAAGARRIRRHRDGPVLQLVRAAHGPQPVAVRPALRDRVAIGRGNGAADGQ